MSGEGMIAADRATVDTPIVVVHIGTDGAASYLMAGPVDFYVVDERSPHDRVYQMTVESTRERIAAVLGDDAVGNCHDDRHPAAAARILAAIDGRDHLTAVKP